jgi:hypothetical protein
MAQRDMIRTTVYIDRTAWEKLDKLAYAATMDGREIITKSELVRRGVAREIWHQNKRREGFTYIPPDPLKTVSR